MQSETMNTSSVYACVSAGASTSEGPLNPKPPSLNCIPTGTASAGSASAPQTNVIITCA